MDQAALQNLTHLRYLFANHNRLRSVPDALPAGLQQLRLAHNQISSISPGALEKLHNLTVLLLQGNQLQIIAGGHVKGCVMCHFLSSYVQLSFHCLQQVPILNSKASRLGCLLQQWFWLCH